MFRLCSALFRTWSKILYLPITCNQCRKTEEAIISEKELESESDHRTLLFKRGEYSQYSRYSPQSQTCLWSTDHIVQTGGWQWRAAIDHDCCNKSAVDLEIMKNRFKKYDFKEVLMRWIDWWWSFVNLENIWLWEFEAWPVEESHALFEYCIWLDIN